MSASFRRVDYSLRPAKHAERRMLCEIFRRLRPFQPVEDYLYVGFGSMWFSDFTLFHRALGIKSMVSIERAVRDRKRIDSNKPYSSIRMDYRETGEALPALAWDQRIFVWLDYDDPLSKAMLLDIETVASRARSGTVLAISIQCHQAAEVNEATQNDDATSAQSFTRFRNKFGQDLLPPDASEEDLRGWPFGKLSRAILNSKIEQALAVRNLNVAHDKVVSFRRICEINYEDGAKMTTLVGIFVESQEHSLANDCGFAELDFLVQNETINIKIPLLTVREIRHIERQLPQNGTQLDLGAIPQSDATQFAKLYRYLPNFAVLEA